MKGVQLSSFGDSSVLEYHEDLPVPPIVTTSYVSISINVNVSNLLESNIYPANILLTVSDVLVKVSHSSINPIDIAVRKGYGKRLLPLKRDDTFPLTLGFDVVGTIVAVGRYLVTYLLS